MEIDCCCFCCYFCFCCCSYRSCGRWRLCFWWDITLCLWVSSSDVSEDRNALMFIINSSALHSYLHGLIHPDTEEETIVRNDCEYLTTHCNILEDLNFIHYCCDYPNLMSLLFVWLTLDLTARWAFPISQKKKEAEERVF